MTIFLLSVKIFRAAALAAAKLVLEAAVRAGKPEEREFLLRWVDVFDFE
ncbi:MAG: hypothetical protein IKU61_06070 [Clostridia bacterium]|nr:hypothetical protein [Clostridia bacterium]